MKNILINPFMTEADIIVSIDLLESIDLLHN